MICILNRIIERIDGSIVWTFMILPYIFITTNKLWQLSKLYLKAANYCK